MNAARTLLTSLIDYAGLFPPAELQMRAAVPRYAAYRDGEYAWMLGRFVLPLAQLDEFEHAFDDLAPSHRRNPWTLAVLGGRNLEIEVRKVVDFNRRHGDEGRQDARIEAMDLKVHALEDIARAADVLSEIAEIYFEIPINADPRDRLAAVASAGGRVKVRMGGVSREMFPSVPDVARFLQAAAAEQVAFKATAGLHNPLRSPHAIGSDEKQAPVVMHGFLNLFVAGILAFVDPASTGLLEKVLEEPTAAAFAFDNSGVTVHGRRLGCEDMVSTRKRFALSYGSCSIEEPVNGLKAIGLLGSSE